MSNTLPYVQISTKALIEFKQIYKEEFGIRLTNEVALQKAMAVLEIFKILKGFELDLPEVSNDH
jgi:hypothetical protein